MSSVVAKEPCPECGSRDNLIRYDDGHAFCFSQGCGRYERGTLEGSAEVAQAPTNKSLAIRGETTALLKRSIKEETCQHFGYRTGVHDGRPAQLAYYFDPTTRKPVGCKVRFPDKTFTFLGDAKATPLYGQWLWRDGGRKVIITEGEIDCLTVSQLQQNKWPVVSLPFGAQSAKKALQKAYEWLTKFDEVVLMFDNDGPGQDAAIECAELFEPGKCKIAQLPEGIKDPNQALQEGKGSVVIDAAWAAKTYRPDGIVSASEMWESLVNEDANYSKPYPWPDLNVKTHGIRAGELTTITAGSGIGKSAVVREIAYSLINEGETVGMIMLEESTKRTALGLLGLELNLPIHISREGMTEASLKLAFDKLFGTGRVYLYDHFGSTEIDNLLNRVRYLAKSLGCKWVILDHLSIVVSGLEGDDERKLIDRAMTMLRTLVQETDIGLILVSHLKRPSGLGHEDGAQTSLSQLRGSAAIAQLSDMVIGLERNQQGDEPNQTVVRVLKNRFSGETGEACLLYYNPITGRLSEAEPFKDQTRVDTSNSNEEF